ncbi:hypothetical protein [Dyadobacter sp. Leaf189]|uniref:hypothetical protein n=1 Tax=Dyadobacter sp. Leaf189 TaxID=1736295 RepID=UPI0006F45443|nr:hypothetical protein [Dyadobacter sp. Leaf189]KQS25568.1 hypothetical protein ASG33_23070 [Dyadobacter sp. Leaf189]
MKKIITMTFGALLAAAGMVSAQTTTTPGTSVPQTVPTQDPATTTPATEKKTDFNAPQSPTRPATIPSEDTLIKGQSSSGAVIKDTLMPSSNRKEDRMNRRKNRKGTVETGDTTSTSGSGPARKQ